MSFFRQKLQTKQILLCENVHQSPPKTILVGTYISIPGTFRPYKTPEEIKPLPQAFPRKKREYGRKLAETNILTDTPNMEKIKNGSAMKQEQRNKKFK
ncbi:hypothetical protein JTB14_016223 [Gonioctena quinquepunctata]|nr:hypothetical protein JTB14_016223 [Gonioctena quinquepunctata]